jgi:hypothetical protein
VGADAVLGLRTVRTSFLDLVRLGSQHPASAKAGAQGGSRSRTSDSSAAPATDTTHALGCSPPCIVFRPQGATSENTAYT